MLPSARMYNKALSKDTQVKMRKQIKYQRLNKNINVTHLSSFLSLMFTSASATWSIRQTQYVSRFKPAWNWSFFFLKFLTCLKRDLFEKSHNTYHVKGQQCCLLSQARLCINSLYSWSLRLYCQFSPLEAISLLLIILFFFSYCLICNGVVYFTIYPSKYNCPGPRWLQFVRV